MDFSCAIYKDLLKRMLQQHFFLLSYHFRQVKAKKNLPNDREVLLILQPMGISGKKQGQVECSG